VRIQRASYYADVDPTPTYIVETLFWSRSTSREVDPEGELSEAQAAERGAAIDADHLADAWAMARQKSLWSTPEEARAAAEEELALELAEVHAELGDSEYVVVDRDRLKVAFGSPALWWIRVRVRESSMRVRPAEVT
jgi:glutathione S-transferase